MIEKSIHQALSVIKSESLLKHIQILASDEFEGRKPGTTGEDRTVDYLVDQCKGLGLELGDCFSGYVQKIPVTGLVAQPAVRFTGASGDLSLASMSEVVARSGKQTEQVRVENSDVIFVGYGIIAPEYGWNDFKNVDVKGKTIVCLIGDPRRAHAQNKEDFDESFFKGKALTYYGRWTYKYEIAFELGAAAVLIVHETDRAGYGFDVVQSSWGGENLRLAGDDNCAPVEGWLSLEAAKKVFAAAGKDYATLKQAAQEANFTAVPLDLKANIDIRNTIRKFTTCNVLGKIEGGDLKDEHVFYCAHWDHFGKTDKGIYSGATDNGSGVAAILEIARAFKALPKAPRRSIMFLFPTLEESGLLGARHYVRNPSVPLDKTVAMINLDSMNLWGRTRKFVSIAQGHSSLDETLQQCAAEQGREIIADGEPEKGYFFRSDHLEFLRKGVPAIFALNPGDDYIGKPADYGRMKRKYYLENDYHKFGDKVKPDWDPSGLAEDAQLLFMTGLAVANADKVPEWKASSEFSAIRRLQTV